MLSPGCAAAPALFLCVVFSAGWRAARRNEKYCEAETLVSPPFWLLCVLLLLLLLMFADPMRLVAQLQQHV